MLRFTLFNGITLFIFAITVWFAAARWRGRSKTKWAFGYYALIAGYAAAFDGSLNWWWIAGGAVCAGALRFEVPGARAAEMVVLGYVLVRCVGLVTMWPW